ncbi:MAG TPA: serine/threonine-protein kinase, partial [Xanthobacteraceae bacterium]
PPLLMKIPRLEHGANPINIVGFEAEQMILPKLSGPHVPRFIACGSLENPYIVMELIDGESLRGHLPKLPLPADEVAGLGAKIASALHDIHRQEVIHLDLKPSNVMLRQSGEVALIDFGFSRHLRLPDILAEEFPGPIGTGPYISPEQLFGNRSDPRSDIFALGVILYFFVTGERPFGDPNGLREWRRRLYHVRSGQFRQDHLLGFEADDVDGIGSVLESRNFHQQRRIGGSFGRSSRYAPESGGSGQRQLLLEAKAGDDVTRLQSPLCHDQRPARSRRLSTGGSPAARTFAAAVVTS